MCAYQKCEPPFVSRDGKTLFKIIHACKLTIHTPQSSTGWDCDIGRKNGKCESGLAGYHKA